MISFFLLVFKTVSGLRDLSFVHKNMCPQPWSHKKFLLQWIRTLLRRAQTCGKIGHTRMPSPSASARRKRFRLSNTKPVLPQDRFNPVLAHESVLSFKQGKCLYCRYQRICYSIEHPGDEHNPCVIRRPTRKCLGCDVYLCRDCFELYHE